MNQQEIIDIVGELNQELFERMGEVWYNKNGWEFSFSGNAHYLVIEFNGMHIWDSENDGREWNYDEQDYTPNLKTHIWNLLMNFHQNLSAYLFKEEIQDIETL